MRQLWPLNRASLETGPFYPFDNGPNGVNTLVAPQWLTRCALTEKEACWINFLFLAALLSIALVLPGQ